jgi:hypothetical protein
VVTGKEPDAESGPDNFGARYYGSALGRFITPDPYNIHLNEQNLRAGGVPEAAAFAFAQVYLENPQNWNQYRYVRNNPLAFVDPTGGAPVDGHHLIPLRNQLEGVAREFADKVKTGPLSPQTRHLRRLAAWI